METNADGERPYLMTYTVDGDPGTDLGPTARVRRERGVLAIHARRLQAGVRPVTAACGIYVMSL